MKASFVTFGCKLNQCETEALAGAFRSQGFDVSSPAAAELCLINTCTVTSKSEQKARGAIRRFSREHPKALLIVTGCAAQLEPDSLRSLGENVVVVPQSDKSLLLDLPEYWKRHAGGFSDPVAGFEAFRSGRLPSRPGVFRYSAESCTFRVRAFVKIQDGCDGVCAYCRVPLARGRSISLEADEVLRRVRRLEERGQREVVLTGISIASYRGSKDGLAGLLSRLLKETSTVRFRLSSLEPEGVTEPLASVLVHPRVRPHFHIPLQSGSDAVLERMRRLSRSREIRKAVERLKEAKPGAFLAADVIAGLPGETDEDFLVTFRLLESLAFSKLHVFPFSPRPGTKACRMEGRVAERIRDGRVKRLLELSERLYRDYTLLWVGRQLEAVLEKEQEEGSWRALSENYLKVLIQGVDSALARPGLLQRLLLEQAGEPCLGISLGTAF